MINTINSITINSSNFIWNGYVYGFDYSPSFGAAPSYATVNLISEDGTYLITDDDLQVDTPHTINVSTTVSLQMYPVEYELIQSSAGKVLSVKYIDTSIILDKKIVVLNGRQGSPVDSFKGSCYIPVGQQLLTATETYNDVLAVVYTFPQLMDAIANNGIIINKDSYTLIQNSSQFYFTSYIGTLRGVLSQWCTDLGLGYYWENNNLHFIDLTTKLILDTSSFDSAVQEANSTKVSIEDTVGRVAAAFYGRPAEFIDFDPGQNTQISFKAILSSLFGFSQDEINSIKAAYLGPDFFITYHFLRNDDYGNQVLGITKRSIADSISGKSLEPGFGGTSFVQKYSQYTYVAQNTDIASANYDIFKQLSEYIGVYFYRGMTFGDYKHMKFDNGIEAGFYNQLWPVSKTPLGNFAGLITAGGGNELLYQFLLGLPYVAPPAQTSTYGQAGFTSSSTLPVVPGQSSGIDNPEDPFDYDPTNGDVILYFKDSPWALNTNPNQGAPTFVAMGPTDVANFLKINNFNSNFVTRIDNNNLSIVAAITPQMLASSATYQAVLTATQAAPIANQQAVPSLFLFGIQQTLPNGQNFNMDAILTPEQFIIDPITGNVIQTTTTDKLINVYIDTPVKDVVEKIEEYFRSETDKTGNTVNCNSNVIKNEMNYRAITQDDLTAIGSLVYTNGTTLFNAYGVQLVMPAVPTPQTLEEIFKDFSVNLTLSKTDPTIVKTYNLPYIDLPNNYQPLIGNGLMGIQIKMGEKGIETTYTMGTRLMQVQSLEVIRANLEFLNHTNQSRFLPYNF